MNIKIDAKQLNDSIMESWHKMSNLASDYKNEIAKTERYKREAAQRVRDGEWGGALDYQDYIKHTDADLAAYAEKYKANMDELMAQSKNAIHMYFKADPESISTSQIEVLKAMDFREDEYEQMMSEAIKTNPTYARLIASSAAAHGHERFGYIDTVEMAEKMCASVEEFGRYCDSLATEKDGAMSDNWGAIVSTLASSLHGIMEL